MNGFVIPPSAPAPVAVSGVDASFPLRRIFYVRRNYTAHACEMGKNPDRALPFAFTGPADAVVDDGATVPFPPLTESLHFEAEQVIAIAIADAVSHVRGYGVGNDLTRRDRQNTVMKMSRPRGWGKAYDGSAICGPILAMARSRRLASGSNRLSVNEAVRQDADLDELVWPAPEVIAVLSQSVAIVRGDLIYSGGSAGVGALVPDDVCMVEIAGPGFVTTTIDPRER